MSETNNRSRKRPSLSGRLSSAATALKRSFSPIPKTPHLPPGNTDDEPTGPLEDLKELGLEDLETLLAFLNAHVHGATDDSELLLERVIQLLAKLPSTSEEGDKLQDGLIHQLWDGLQHPPMTTLGHEHRYREADGSNNNIHMPDLGKAGSAYARTTPPLTYQSASLPDPEIIFDTLLARDKFEPHPNRISSVLFYLATIIIHDIFQTDHPNYHINQTSSYLDLSPLYGRNLEETRAMRTFKDGLLKPDCFSSKRILGFPPGVGVFLIMFNRFHNYVVTQLAHINEKGRFDKPKSADDAGGWKRYDEDLYQHGRLITGGIYVNMILRDYVRTILNLNRAPTSWALDPRTTDGKNLFSKPTPMGVGNQVSAEFNLIYRWHSSLSERDVKWTEEEFARVLGEDIDPETADLHTVLQKMGEFEKGIPEDPLGRSVAGLTRNADGTLPEDDLVRIWCESVDDLASAFGANKVPRVLRTIDILGIVQARHWNLGTLNEFRECFGLTRHKTFTDINPDKEVAKRLQHLYDSVDSVELYPGLVAEKAKPAVSPGSGLCVNFTISRAILSDAVTLVRGDRFYTLDYTPKNLTNWGYNEASWDRNVDNGHVFFKLVNRAFPKHFAPGSVYAHFPFVIPSENKKILEKLGKDSMYSWERPTHAKGDLIMVRSYEAAKKICSDQTNFKVTWGAAISFLTDRGDGNPLGANFCLAGDKPAHTKNREVIRKALFEPKGWEKEVSTFYARTVKTLLAKYSHSVGLPGGKSATEVDVVRDVINMANTRFCAALFCLPIKIEESPAGVFTEQELYLMLTAIFASIFFDADPAASLKVRTLAHDFAGKIAPFVALVGQAVDKAGTLAEGLANLKEKIGGHPTLSSYGNEFIGRLTEKGKSVDEAVWGTIMPLISANVPNQSQVLAQCLDFYLGDGHEHLPELYRLAREDTPAADEVLMHYMLEGCRLRGTPAVYRDIAADSSAEDYATATPNPDDYNSPNPLPIADPAAKKTTVPLPKGRRVVVNLVTAGRDATAFPEPDKVKLDRPIDSYIHFGWGPHRCGGMETSRVAQTALFKALVGLKGLRRTKGPMGQVKSMPVRKWDGQIVPGTPDVNSLVWLGLRTYMTGDQSGYFPVPTTMRVLYDKE